MLIGQKLVEHSVVRYKLETNLTLDHARWLRGAIGRQMDRPEFHHHRASGFDYRHPLIRYDVCNNDAMLMGLADGAFLLRGLPPMETLRLGPHECRVVEQSTQATRLAVGPCEQPAIYRFQTPYLALNQDNHIAWKRADLFARRRLLRQIIVGNLLSLAKAINLHVGERLHADVELEPDGWHALKPGLQLLGFRGAIQVNFAIPDQWGIGKSSAKGFGTLIRQEARNGQSEDQV